MKNLGSFLKGIIWVMLVIIIVFFAVKYLMPAISETKTQTTYNFTPGVLRAQAKLVIWEQDFTLNFTEKKEKKYFNSDWFKFTSSIATSAKGRMGFHIDLSDSLNTKIKYKNDTVYIDAPLELTYIEINPATIEMIKKASIDPTINLSKDTVIKRLNHRAIEQFLEPNIEAIKLHSLEDQEKSLSRLVNKPVKIKLSETPQVRELLNIDWSKY